MKTKGIIEEIISEVENPEVPLLSSVTNQITSKKLVYYAEDSIAEYKGVQRPFKGKGRAFLLFLSSKKNIPYSVQDIIEGCNPLINNPNHFFKTDKDVRDTLNYIKKCLNVKNSEFFPISKIVGSGFMWSEK